MQTLQQLCAATQTSYRYHIQFASQVPTKTKQTRCFDPVTETQSTFNKTESLSGGMFSPAQVSKLVPPDTLSEFTARL